MKYIYFRNRRCEESLRKCNIFAKPASSEYRHHSGLRRRPHSHAFLRSCHSRTNCRTRSDCFLPVSSHIDLFPTTNHRICASTNRFTNTGGYAATATTEDDGYQSYSATNPDHAGRDSGGRSSCAASATDDDTFHTDHEASATTFGNFSYGAENSYYHRSTPAGKTNSSNIFSEII